MKAKIASTTDDADKLMLAQQLGDLEKISESISNKKEFATERAKSLEAKSLRYLNSKNKLDNKVSGADETIVKASSKEISAKAQMDNANSEKDGKAQAQATFDGIVQMSKEASEKADAAEILAEKSKELNIKKIKERMGFKKEESEATESSEKSQEKMRVEATRLHESLMFARRMSNLHQKVDDAKKQERDSRRKQLEADAKKSSVTEKTDKIKEKTAKALLREKAAKTVVKDKTQAVNEEKRSQLESEKKKKAVLAQKLRASADKTAEVENKLSELTTKSDESRTKKSTTVEKMHENEEAGEVANKGFRKAERESERITKDTKIKASYSDQEKELAAKAVEKSTQHLEDAKEQVKSVQASVSESRKSERTFKQSLTAATTEERNIKAGSDSQIEALNKQRTKADQARKRDDALAAKLQEETEEKANKVNSPDWIPIEEATAVQERKEKRDADSESLREQYKTIDNLKLQVASAPTAMAKQEAVTALGKAELNVQDTAAKVKVSQSEYDAEKKRLHEKTASNRQRYMQDAMKKKQQALAASEQAEIRLKENKNKADRLMDSLKMSKSLGIEKTSKTDKAVERLKALELEKSNAEHTLSMAESTLQMNKGALKTKQEKAVQQHKKSQSAIKAAEEKIASFKKSQNQAKALGDKLVEDLARMSKIDIQDKSRRDSMAKHAEAMLGKNSAIVEKINEKKAKAEEAQTAADIREARRSSNAAEENTDKEAKRKIAERNTKISEGAAYSQAARDKAKDAAKKDLNVGTEKEMADKTRTNAELAVKSAVSDRQTSVRQAKTARIELDEARSEVQIKSASARLAGAKAGVMRAQHAYKIGSEKLQKATINDAQLSKEKSETDAELRVAAKKMKQEEEKENKMQAEKAMIVKTSLEQQQEIEVDGKEKIRKYQMSLKATEANQEKKVKETAEKFAATKKERESKIADAAEQIQESTQKHDADQKEIWEKEKQRRSERADKEVAREKQQKTDESTEKEKLHKQRKKRYESDTKAHELAKYRAEREDKEGSKKTEAKEAGASLEQLKAREAAAKKNVAAAGAAVSEALDLVKHNREMSAKEEVKIGAYKSEEHLQVAQADKAKKFSADTAARTASTLEADSAKIEERESKAAVQTTIMRKREFDSEQNEKAIAVAQDISSEQKKVVLSSNSPTARSEAAANEKNQKDKALELSEKNKVLTKELDAAKKSALENKDIAAGYKQGIVEAKEKKAAAETEMVEQDKKASEATNKKTNQITAEMKAKHNIKEAEEKKSEAEEFSSTREEKNQELKMKARVANDQYQELSGKAEERTKKHERATKSSQAEEKTEKEKDSKEQVQKAAEGKEKEAEQKAVEASYKAEEEKKQEKKAKAKVSKQNGADENARKDEMRAKEAKTKILAKKARGTASAEKALQFGERINKDLEKAEKASESAVKATIKGEEKTDKKGMERANKSKEVAKKQKANAKKAEIAAKENLSKLVDKEKQAKVSLDKAGETKEAKEKAEEKTAKSDAVAKREATSAAASSTKVDESELAAKREVARAEKEVEQAPNSEAYAAAKAKKEAADQAAAEQTTKEGLSKSKSSDATKNREKSLGEEKDAKSKHQTATSAEAAAKALIESLKTKESEAKSELKESLKSIADADAEEVNQKTAIKNHQEREKSNKEKLKKRAGDTAAEKAKKEKDSKKTTQEKNDKVAERKVKATEVTSKAVEKTVKEAESEKNQKQSKKDQLYIEQQEKQNAVKEQATKESKTKAECAAKQESEQMQVRFTLAQDRQVEISHGWQNFGNGYEGIRLQKQGNVCLLSGLIRVASDDIQTGVDKGKQFWHSTMETLIQTGESSIQNDKNKWGVLATVDAHCRPTGGITLLANNHVDPATVEINKDGEVKWVAGGSAHGWISLSGLAWKAGGPIDGQEGGTSIAGYELGKVVYANGWEGTGVEVYKQGHICFVAGTLTNGRNFDGRALTLPVSCRPKTAKMFVFAHDKQTYRIDVSTDGAVTPINVAEDMKKQIDLSNIVFSTEEGEAIKLSDDKNWEVSKRFPKAEAIRQGSLCVLSGTAYNSDVRDGIHSLLKNSGSPGVLPEWCKPRHRMSFSTVAEDGKLQRIDVLADGSVRWIAGKRSKFMNLDGIRFDVRADLVQKFSHALLKISKCE